MACAVTALPILILLMEKLDILRQPLGQRILRYASLDDIAIWGVLALILMDWTRVGKQLGFLLAFAVVAWAFRRLMARLPEADRWYLALVWLALCSLGADWAGLHFMVGRLPGRRRDGRPLVQPGTHGPAAPPRAAGDHAGVLPLHRPADQLEHGRRRGHCRGGPAAGGLGRRQAAGRAPAPAACLRWAPGEARTIGWLLQTKALIMIIFANILLDKAVITNASFTALLLMAVASTMLTVPMVSRCLGGSALAERLEHRTRAQSLARTGRKLRADIRIPARSPRTCGQRSTAVAADSLHLDRPHHRHAGRSLAVPQTVAPPEAAAKRARQCNWMRKAPSSGGRGAQAIPAVGVAQREAGIPVCIDQGIHQDQAGMVGGGAIGGGRARA